jgi:multidrug resistance protein
MSRIKFLILLTVCIDILGIGIIIPVLPFYVESFGVGAFTVTALLAVYSLFSFFSSPLLGSLSDRIGRRWVLIGSIVSSAIGWLMFAMAHNVAWLFAGRIIDGLAAGNITTAQSCLVDIAKDDKERSHNLGMIGAVFGIGFIVGPLLGGVLSHFGGATMPFWVVGIMSLLNALLAVFILPETNTHRNTAPLRLNPFAPIIRALRDVNLRPAYLVWFLFGLAATTAQSVFSLYVSQVFGFSAFVTGLFLTGVGLVIAVNQGFGIKHFWLKKFKEPQLEVYMIIAFGIGHWLLAIGSLPIFIIGMIFTTFGQAVLRVVMTSQALSSIDPRMKGEVLGVLNSVFSLSMVVAPVAAGWLFEHARPGTPFVVTGVYMAIALYIVYRNRRRLARVTMQELEESSAVL